MTNHGWRKPTPELERAEQLAQVGEQIAIPKNRALIAVKRIAAHIGLKAADIMLLDNFCAFTQPQDWEEGRRPIIWTSNNFLMAQTGFSLSTLKRHAKRLAEAGVITFRDSPNGKRWGRRDSSGHIIEAYGYDLSPLAARAEEFETLFQRIHEERQHCARLKRQITIARRTIRSKLDAITCDNLLERQDGLHEAYRQLIGSLPRCIVSSAFLQGLLKKFAHLQQEIDLLSATPQPVDNPANPEENSPCHTLHLNPTRAENEPHILTTKEPDPVICNELKNTETRHIDTRLSKGRNPDKRRVSVLTIMQTCPQLKEISIEICGHISSWNGLHHLADRIRPMLGITENIWNEVQSTLGIEAATASMALVFEKFSNGEINSPGGYLKGMIRKARKRELYLEKSFWGRSQG